jgi:hypothetical protein
MKCAKWVINLYSGQRAKGLQQLTQKVASLPEEFGYRAIKATNNEVKENWSMKLSAPMYV